MKVILAIDGTPESDAALAAVNMLGTDKGLSVHIVTAVDLSVPLGIDLYGGFLPDNAELERIAGENADVLIEKAKAAVSQTFPSADLKVSGEVLFGSPESKIVEAAEAFSADLIIIGSHGYKSWERLLLGSVSDSVAHHAPCSVLIVRSKS